MEHYDVGISGVWYGCNYGSIATYYALHQIISSMGKSVLMIDKPLQGANDKEQGSTHSRRFAKEHYKISKMYHLNELGKLNQLCDVFLLGSDQLWNYGISKGFGKSFYFDYVDDQKKKIAYATSFGHAIDFAPIEERKKIASYMGRFDGISLREDDGVKICRKDYGINAIQVLDPVFLADPSIYQPLVQKSTTNETEPYLVTYILDPTPEKRQAILHVSRMLGEIKIINMLDGMPGTFEKNQKKLNLPNCVNNLQVEDWLYYFAHAQFVITDSCHGASFAMIFKKNFIAICNKGRGFSRFQSLARLFHVEDYVVSRSETIITEPRLLEPVDYRAVDSILQEERERSYVWLEQRLNEKKKSKSQLIEENIIGTLIKKEGGNTITSNLDMKMCTGCSACLSACPVDAISLKSDVWGYYRSNIDYSKCIECGKCTKVCPAMKLPEINNTKEPDCYEFISSNDEILQKSSSGGIFPTMAAQILKKDGVVAGAAWREDFSVEHIVIDSIKDLPKLQKSKYLQSYLGNVFRQVKKELEDGKKVLFSGCPCQVAGLRKYLGRDNKNLLLVDFLCGNSPSAGFFKKYIEDSFPDGIMKYEFRHKSDTLRWDSIHVQIVQSDGTIVERSGGMQDAYQRVYHSHTMCAPHCEKCRYQAFPRQGDITIGDFWGIGKKDPELDTFKGVSIVLCNNQKGKEFFLSISEEKSKVRKKVPLSWMGGNGYSRNGGHNYASPHRDDFYKAILDKPFEKAVNYALKPNHGEYRSVYQKTNSPLQFDANIRHFNFDKNIWEEHTIEGKPTLIVKAEQWKQNGHYARLPLSVVLDKNKKYRMAVKFKIKSLSNVINFHIIDCGSKQLQIVHSEKIAGKNSGEEWIEFEVEFRPNSSVYDEFMVGASQVSGHNNFLAFEYINISECDE